jgi:hypothetical protein
MMPDFHKTERIKPDKSTWAKSDKSHSTINETQTKYMKEETRIPISVYHPFKQQNKC